MNRFRIPIIFAWGSAISYIIYQTHLTNIKKTNINNQKKNLTNQKTDLNNQKKLSITLKKEDFENPDFNPFRSL